MTRKRKIICAAVILVAVLLSFIVGQTFSKYITKVNGTGIASVAKWSFKVNGETEQMSTISLTNTYNENTLTNGKIAPGTSGSFEIVVDTEDSEVGVDYKVEFKNENSKPQNLKYIYENNKYDSLQEIQTLLSGTIDANSENKIVLYTINWEWNYEDGTSNTDIQDTNDGTTIDNYTFDVVVTGNQVSPSK